MKTVLCHGKFDILHAGHLFYLSEAKKLGDRLIVTITGDDYLKNPGHFNEQERKKALELVGFIDEVHIIHHSTGIPAITEFKPDIYAKGPDYLNSTNKTLALERQTIEDINGKLVIISPDIRFSSTKIKHSGSPFIDLSKEKFEIGTILRFIETVKHLNVHIIGETIIDAFQTVELDGQSAKSSCPSYLLVDDYSKQEGGAKIIARHLDYFCKSVSMTTNSEPIIKLRYIDKFRNKKHFEVKTIKQHKLLKKGYPVLGDLTFIADFGHGLLTGTENFGHSCYYIMAQTNSSNYGYNIVNKWNKINAKLVCIDRVEGSLLLGRKFTEVNVELMQELKDKLNTCAVILTMHKYGAVYFDGKHFETLPALATTVVDTIGAGDAFFTFASLAHFMRFPPKYILLIGAIAAAMTTQWLCNEKVVTPEEFLKTAKVIL